MQSNILVAILSLFGVIVGAMLTAASQYYFTRMTESSKTYQNLRTTAYVDFIRSTAEIAMSQKMQDKEKELKGSINLTDAKGRIGIYGSKQVVAAIAAFFRNYGALTSPAAYSAFLEIVRTMRSETPGGEEAIPIANMGQLLFSDDLVSKPGATSPQKE
jgi:hypothetical protein